MLRFERPDGGEVRINGQPMTPRTVRLRSEIGEGAFSSYIAPSAVRFQLEPGVQASLARDRRSILLRGPSGRGWWFRTDAPDVAIEPSVHVEDGLTRRSLQLVARGSARTDGETKIRWKISPAGAAEGH